MNRRWLITSLVAVGALAFFGSRAVSQDEGNPAGNGDDPMKAMMEAYVKMSAPGDAHKKLEPMIGEWESHTKIFMAGPGGPAMESKGTTTNKWVLNGRFVLTEHKGMMMGMDHEGIGLTGYDTIRNMYVGAWADNVNSFLLTMKGTVDHKTGKVFTMYGEMDEPMLKVYGRWVKYVTRIIDNDKHVFEIYDLHAAEDYKVLEITYTRKK